jgi:hypothetical protein
MKSFWDRVLKASPDECWIWTGVVRHSGHGTLLVNGSRKQAHRFAYELSFGPLPVDQELVQTCNNKLCVNPKHLVIATPEFRFWSKVVVGNKDDCWPWTASLFHDGYGEFGLNGKVVRAHRYSYELAHGQIPDNQLVLHSCDNPPCVNPNHLFLGDDLVNSHDMFSKGREKRLPGILNGNSVLDDATVIEIRHLSDSGMKGTEIASIIGVHKNTVYNVLNNKYWKHVR